MNRGLIEGRGRFYLWASFKLSQNGAVPMLILSQSRLVPENRLARARWRRPASSRMRRS